MAETRTFREGSLRWVQASGTGRAWGTAATPVSGIFGYVKSFSITSAQTVTTISDRGTPDHHKVTEVAPIDVSVQFMWTGRSVTAVSGAGASVPMVHLEWRASAPEIGNGTTGDFIQIHGVAMPSLQWTENADGDTVDLKLVALAMNGPTGSGYLS